MSVGRHGIVTIRRLTDPVDSAALLGNMRMFAALANQRDRLPARIFLLAVIVLAGKPVSAQSPSAPDLAIIRQRAESAEPEAQNALGNAYTNGLMGLPQDYAQALVWYHRAAEKGFAPAQFNLGLAYELGRGVPPNDTAAFGHYLRAAEQGFGAALFNIGNMYATGRGVRQDLFEANIWYRQAAEKDIPEAQFNLGLAYESGRGLKQDETQAAQWYRRAADRGFSLAQYNLGLLLEDGRGGEKDEVSSARYYRAAAEQGLGSAQHNYGLMLHEGRGGLRQDPVQALFWLSLAVENGIEPQSRDIVAKALSPAQNAAVRQLLDSYHAGTSPAKVAGALASTARPSAETRTERIAANSSSAPSPAADRPPPGSTTPRLEQTKVQSVDPALVDQLRDQVSRLARQVLTLQAEKNAMEGQLATRPEDKASATSPDQPDKLDRLAGLLRQAEAENKRLSQEIGNLRTSASGAAATADQTRRLGERIRELESELQLTRKSTPSDPGLNSSAVSLQQQVIVLRAEKDELEKWVQVLEASVKAAPSQVAAEAGLSSLKQQLTETEEMLAVTKSALTAQMKQEEKLKVENSMLTYRFQRAEEMLAAQLSTNPKPSELGELKQALMDSRQTTDRLTKEKEGLAHVWQEGQFDLKKARERIADLEQELAEAWKKLERTGDAAKPGKFAPVAPGDQLLTRQQIEGMVKEHENALALLDISKQALGASQGQVAELKAEIKRQQRQLEEARATQSHPTSNRDKATSEQIARLQAENEALSERLAKAQATIDLIIKAVRGDAPVSSTSAATSALGAGTPGVLFTRFHRVQDGDSLSRISQLYYGTPDRGQEIRLANRETLKGDATLRVGQNLLIP